ncbi:MAG: glycosyltransferase family 2 protein [Bacteroidetes bacterium]|nr:glycosyltransferase family 2 protein [Bacteroidota bacterium]MBU1577935.1 glycosyltransferase family 2 protein [Bacteroidota bacterium]MBU2556580.1 glycosyltransferase family 2 protein [Bacteroidota bacterium]
MDVSIVVPLLNEEESLPELAKWINQVVTAENLSCEIIFVDDGSTDDSWKVIQTIAKSQQGIKAIRFRRNYGKSAALNEGFKMAEAEVVITMDADLQDSPEEIPALVKMIREEGWDMVSGWKKKRHDPISKTLPSKFFNWTTRRISAIKLHDFNCGLKAYKLDLVKNIEVHGEMHRYIPLIAQWAGYKQIGEKVVQHQERKFGRTKFGMSRFIKGFLDLLSITFVAKFGKRPMHLFGALGTLLFMIGFLIAGYLAYAKFFMEAYRMTDRPLFYFGLLAMMMGVQLFLTGFLAELVSLQSRDQQAYLIKETLNHQLENSNK